VAPQFIVKELLKAEGFTDIKYVKLTMAATPKALASGEVDITMGFVGPLVIHGPPGVRQETSDRDQARATGDLERG
jgi:ABC-type proline/glycine betaine transport system substrate-binding protein